MDTTILVSAPSLGHFLLNHFRLKLQARDTGAREKLSPYSGHVPRFPVLVITWLCSGVAKNRIISVSH